MADSAWLVGSVTLAAQTFLFDGDDVDLPAGTYYLRHGTGGLSLLDVVNALLDAAPSSVTCTSLVVLRNRLVQINLSGVAEIDWTTGGGNAQTLADALGFAGTDLTGAASYTAPEISPLLFSPGFPATPKTLEGTEGYTVSHQSRYKADDGTQVYVAHYGDEIWQELGWSHIQPERMRTATSVGGTFHEFYENVGKLGRRFFYYPLVDEDDTSSSAVTWTSGLGPYVLREADGDWYRRNVPNAEVSCSLELPMHMVDELS